MYCDEKEILILSKLKNAVVEHDEVALMSAIEEVFLAGINPQKAVFEGLVPGIQEVSRLYEEGVYFIPELLVCTEVLYNGLAVFKKHLQKDMREPIGTVIIGVVEGDIHDIGKNLVKMMLESAGFVVIDLGRDVPLYRFLSEHRKICPDIVCLSTMMTTTLQGMKKVVMELRKRNPKVKIMVGGAPLSDDIAKRWGGCGYAPNAHQAVKKALEMIVSIKNLSQQ